jgi:hypothetical protein
MKKRQILLVWSAKWFLPQHFAQFAEAGKRHSKV